MKKFYTEAAYIIGILILALGTAMMERADFGMSMVVAPAYLIHLKVSQFIPAFSFGMAEYCLQAVLLIVISVIMGRFKKMYLFSFVTAVFYGISLDLFMKLIALIPGSGMIIRIILYVVGLMFCASGVSLLFHTYIAPEAYELMVKEISAKYEIDIHKVKIVYDVSSCIIAVVMSFAFFGLWHFEGVKAGTVICALINGVVIGRFSKIFEKHFVFVDKLKK